MSPDNKISTADLESNVPFGRSRLLKGLGLFVFSSLISACSCNPAGCHGFATCSSCSGINCTLSGCKSTSAFCESHFSCWSTCSGHSLLKCCDYEYAPSAYCLCGASVGSC